MNMALAQAYTHIDTYTEAEYFQREEAARHKSEWVKGEIRAMAGASETHNLIAANAVASLNRMLVPKKCRVYGSDMKVHTGGGANFILMQVSSVDRVSSMQDGQALSSIHC